LYHPELFKTRSCKHGSNCHFAGSKRQQYCPFAHGSADKRESNLSLVLDDMIEKTYAHQNERNGKQEQAKEEIDDFSLRWDKQEGRGEVKKYLDKLNGMGVVIPRAAFQFEQVDPKTKGGQTRNSLKKGTDRNVFTGKLDGKDVVVKVCDLGHKLGHNSSRKWKDTFNEVRILESVRCRYVADCVGLILNADDDISKPSVGIVTQYYNRGSLKKYLRDEREMLSADFDKRLDLAFQAASGLEYLHKRLIHRDIKADNFLVEDRGDSVQVRVTDFGFSRWKEAGHDTNYTSALAGTWYWMAPEILRAHFESTGRQHIGQMADVYAFGIVMWEIDQCGRDPYEQHLRDGGERTEFLRTKVLYDGERPRFALKSIGKNLAIRDYIEVVQGGSDASGNGRVMYLVMMETCWDALPQQRRQMGDVTK